MFQLESPIKIWILESRVPDHNSKICTQIIRNNGVNIDFTSLAQCCCFFVLSHLSKVQEYTQGNIHSQFWS